MTSNFMLASYGWMQGWLYEVLVYGIDHSLKLNGCSRPKDDNICLSYSMWAVWALEFCLAVFELLESGKLASNPVNQP